MKRFFAIFTVTVLILLFVGCANEMYEIPHDQFCESLDGRGTLKLDYDDKKYIVNLLNASSWSQSQSETEYDFIFFTQRQEVRYNSILGTFTDVTNNVVTTVSEEQRTAINDILILN